MKNKFLFILFLFSSISVFSQSSFSGGLVGDGNGSAWNYNSVTEHPISGDLHAMWRDGSGSSAVYKLLRWTGTIWVTVGSFNMSDIDASTPFDLASDDVSLDIDNSGVFHVAVRGGASGSCCTQARGIAYAFSANGTSWTIETVSTYSAPSGFQNVDDPIIRVDNSGVVHIGAQFTDSNNSVSYAGQTYNRFYSVIHHERTSTNTWVTSYPYFQGGSSNEVNEISMALDTNGNPHFAWKAEVNGSGLDGNLMYTVYTGSGPQTASASNGRDAGWAAPTTILTGSTSAGEGNSNDIEIDPTDNSIHIISYGPSGIQYSKKTTGSFSTTVVNGTSSGFSQQNLFNITPNGTKFFFFNNSTSYKTARLTSGTTWTISSGSHVPPSGAGSFPSSWLSSSGTAMILFNGPNVSGGDRQLFYATGSIGSSNSAPTDISLSSTSVGQSTTGVNATIATLSTTDSDVGDTHTYSLVNGLGDTDNANFNINGNLLRSNGALITGSHNIRINTSDGTDDFEKQFTINITDDIAPVVSNVSVPPNDTYDAGEHLDFTVSFTESITVSGIPQLSLTLDSSSVQADYSGGSGTNNLTFRYTVLNGDYDIDGISINSLSANSGSLRDAASNDANLTLNNVASTTNIKVFASDVTYTTTNGFQPANPNGFNLDNYNLDIQDGTALINSAMTFNSITVESDAVLDIDANITVVTELVFESDASGSGQLADTNGSTITGDIAVRRFIPAGDNNRRVFRFLSSPINSTNSIHDNWQEGATSNTDNPNPGFGTHITGSTTDGLNGFDGTNSGQASLKVYDNTSQTWSDISNTDVNTLESGNAYNLFVRGDRSIDLTSNSQSPTNTVLRSKGTLASGSVDFSSDLSTGANDFNLIGNPYQAIVDFTSLTVTDIKTTFIYVWDPNGGTAGNYVSFDGSPGLEMMIQPGQSFFVQNSVAATSPSLIFNQDDKNPSGVVTSVFNTSQLASVNLELYNTANNIKLDVMKFRFEAGADNGIDDFDAGKLGNPTENLASVNGNTLLSIERRDLPKPGEILPLFINQYQDSQYEFRLNTLNLNDNVEIYIVDNYLNTETLISDNQAYSFTVDASIPESSATDRFSIGFENTTLGIDDNEFSNNFSLYPNPTKDGLFSIKTQNLNAGDVEIRILNLMGQQVMKQNHKVESNGEINVNATNLSSGVYMVELSQNNQNFTTKLIIQ